MTPPFNKTPNIPDNHFFDSTANTMPIRDDVPNVNTLIVHEADRMGLSQ